MSLPFISIVIPTFNRPERIRECVNALKALDYPRESFEVILVDDGSPQPVIPQWSAEAASLNLQVIRQNRQGPAHARNTGLERASGSLVAFTDDDCRPHQQWLLSLAAAHRQDPAAAFAGPVHNAFPRSIPSEASQMLVDYCRRYFNRRRDGIFYTSNNLAFPARQLRSSGGFDTTFPLAAGEDRELCARWIQHGFRIVYISDAAIDHYHLLTFTKFLKQHFNYGRGAWYFHLARAAQASEQVRVEPARFYTGMLRTAFQQPFPRSLAILALLGLSQALTAAGFFFERRKSRLKDRRMALSATGN